MATTPLLLVDGSSYLYRAYHALPSLTTSQGQPTGAILGVTNMLRKLLAQYQPDAIAVIFDSKEKTFREVLYPDYKAHRESMPEELRLQVEPLHNIIRAMGIPLLVVHGVEADDVIGTLAYQAAAQNQPVIISTGDKDMAQLVNAHITLINTMTNTLLDEQGVFEKFGVRPESFIDYLTLVGDSSDNVPGVPGVGPKTAAKWLSQYHCLDNILVHANEIKGKVGEKLRAHSPQFPLMKSLITIKCDVELPLTLKELHRKAESTDELNSLIQQFEFKNWAPETNKAHISKSPTISLKSYACINTIEALTKLIERCQKIKLFAFDTETTSLRIMEAKLVGLSFAFEQDEAFYIPVMHDYLGAPAQLDLQFVLERLKPILEDPAIHKICHHAKYDKNVLANYDIDLQGVAFDTMLESYVFDSVATRHDMDSCAMKYLGKKTISFEEVAGKGSKQLTFNQISIEQAMPYAAEDADITLQLHQYLWPKLQAHPDLSQTFSMIEIPLALVLAEMERHGVLIDATLLTQQSHELSQRIQALEHEAITEVGKTFNLSSPKQLQEILYDQLGLPVIERTPSGQPSTAESVLQELAPQYTLPRIILEHRTLSKLKSTYTDKLPEQINMKTQRVHTSYQQAVAATGRLSSSNPNLQNIPIRTKEGRRIRQAFIAPQGYKIVAADYSQIELRLMAHLSQDKGLLHAFAKEIDIHRATAAEIFDTTLENVDSEQRRRAKAINFGLIYGMSAFGLAKQIGVDRNTAQAYIDVYFQRYPGIKAYMENTRQLAHAQQYVTTIFGRQLKLPDINSRKMVHQRAAERAAINAPLQGSAADLIKLAMIHIQKWLKEHSPTTHMIMQVHDELVFELPEAELDKVVPSIKTLMENAMPLSVPLVVSIGIGNNWDEAH